MQSSGTISASSGSGRQVPQGGECVRSGSRYQPESTGAWFNKSLALVHLGKDNEALRALDKILTLNPRDREAQSKRAFIVRKMARASGSGKPDLQSVQSHLRVWDCHWRHQERRLRFTSSKLRGQTIVPLPVPGILRWKVLV